MKEATLREDICEIGRSIFDRGLTHGSTGNISARCADGWLLTPTGSNLGRLDPARLSKLDWNGKHVSGDAPSRESFLHLAMYQERPASGAVVHLHSLHAVAVSCLGDVNPADVFPPITAYAVMQVGKLALAPYYPPGDASLAEAVRKLATEHHAILLANHGPVVAGTSLEAALNAIEELEQTAHLMLLLQGRPTRLLTAQQVAELNQRFPS